MDGSRTAALAGSNGAAPPASNGADLATTNGAALATTNGAVRAVDLAPSTYLQYLPLPYQGDPFVGRFLRIFEDILAPIERQIDTVADCLDPRLAPAELLPWLESWVSLEPDENWPAESRRELIGQAATLFRWRGTRRGLREHLRIYTGWPPLIVENFTGMRLGQDAALGINTRLGEVREHCIAVTVIADRPEQLNEPLLRRIVEADKPAHVAYTLEVRAADPQAAGPSPQPVTPAPATSPGDGTPRPPAARPAGEPRPTDVA